MKQKLKIAFLLLEPNISGGAFVIYIQAKALRAFGHEVTLIFQKKGDPKFLTDFFSDFSLPCMQYDKIPREIKFDIAIATWWETFFALPKISAEKYFYFVQSDERKFYTDSALMTKKWVEVTYSFPEIGIITEAKWIKNFLENDFKLTVAYAPNGINNKIFNPHVQPIEPKTSKLRVLIEGPGDVEFKRVNDAFRIAMSVPDIEIWYVSSTYFLNPAWRYDRLFQQVPFSKMPSIYKSCDVLIKVSAVEGFFGPPLEMMATGGTCIVSDVSGYDEYIKDGYNALVIRIGDIEAGVVALEKLKNNRKLLAQLSQNGLSTAKDFDWTNQYPKFEAGLLELFSKKEKTSKTLLDVIDRLSFLRGERHFSYSMRYKIVDWIVYNLQTKFPFIFRMAKKVFFVLNYRRKQKKDHAQLSSKSCELVKSTTSQVKVLDNKIKDLNPGPILFVGQREYFRGKYFDAVEKYGHFEYSISLGNLNTLLDIPKFVQSRNIKNLVVFRPEWFSECPNILHDLKNQNIRLFGYSSEPVPLDSVASVHEDQKIRFDSLLKVKSLPYDGIIHFDPASKMTLKRAGIQNLVCHPLPISRLIFFPEEIKKDFDLCFLGHSTPYREKFLVPLKISNLKIVHIAHGLVDEDARNLMNRSKIVLNLHNQDYLNFEDRIIQALFCKKLVLSEPLSNDLLLEGQDYISFRDSDELLQLVIKILKSGEWQSPQIDESRLKKFEIERFFELLNYKDVLENKV